ncbi:MAG: N-hydroxyarylamine O-acetyltransferase [Solirubrobacteraceae bacterium]|jgi:N-hydroxyarylamine O-acetyltransferase|nr:N-hydroxyarylamine O-acetyltransferase [Solirubrobacteraceae bacterium]
MTFDLDAYLERIGVTRDASLREIHRAHVCSIPFENLDPRGGVRVSLDIEHLQDKLVTRRRGGYCFEQNLLLKAALEALGMEVVPLLARVTIGAPPGTVRGRTHLVLRVDDVWHVDVGFGLGGLLEPLPFGPGDEHIQSGWRFQNHARDEHVVFYENGAEQYVIELEPAPMVDLEVSNWYTATYPGSIFTTKLMVAIHRPDGTCVSLGDREGLQLSVHTPSGREVTPVTPAEVPGLLEQHFGLRDTPIVWRGARSR